jgi:type I restriction enzyme R subunit
MRDRSAMSLAAANREVWELLRDGVKVSVPDLERGGQKIERVRLAGRGESLSGWLVDSGK